MPELEPLEEGEESVLRFGQLSIASQGSTSQHGRAITQDMLVRAVERQNPSRPIAASAAVSTLAKQTHMHLNGHRINIVSNLHLLKKLNVLYLYDNQICSMRDGFVQLQNLTHLYLQNNNISQIEGIAGVANLSKLYLQGNCIAHVDNLHGLPSLEELHLSKQRLAPGKGLTFDLHSMHAVSGTLRVLVAAQCGIGDETAAMLPPLPQLRKLDFTHNWLEVVESLEVVMRSAGRLMMVELHGNPFCKGPAQRYRDSVILMSDSMATLDGEEVTQQQRAFLLRFQLQKLKNQVAAEQATEEQADPASLSENADTSLPLTAGGRRPLSTHQSMPRGGSSQKAHSFGRTNSPEVGARVQGGGFDLPVLAGTRIR